jgi:broad specificity phosphatase PhoE
VTLYLVRHGRAAAGWDADPDPGLDATGREQALGVAVRLAGLPPRPVVTSPYLRCRETAQPIADRWRIVPEVVEELGEIPSPEGVPMDRRGEWLMGAMAGTWADLGPRWTAYRDALLAGARALASRDAVAFTHFVAINAVIGAATGDDRVMIRSLDNCSVTVVDVRDDGSLVLLEGGDEADTIVR